MNMIDYYPGGVSANDDYFTDTATAEIKEVTIWGDWDWYSEEDINLADYLIDLQQPDYLIEASQREEYISRLFQQNDISLSDVINNLEWLVPADSVPDQIPWREKEQED